MRIAGLALVSVMVTLPLFLSDSLFMSQDILFHLTWSEQFHKALAEGVIYPRWVDTPSGYGSPVFIFYAPLSFYVISFIDFFANSHILSMKIALCLSFFLSGLTMYFFARKLNGERAGLVSALIYGLFPYHIFNLYVRGVFPELFAFIWFPLILFLMRKIFLERTNTAIVYAGLAYAGLILTHLVSSFMFTFVMIAYGFYLAFVENKRGLLRLSVAMVLGLGLSSVYLLPVIFERPFIHIDFINFFNYKDCFLFLRNNLMDKEFYPIPHGIFIMEAAFLAFSLLLIRRRFIDPKNVFFVLILFASLFLTVPLSALIWQSVPRFSDLQFPWRWLTFSGLSVSVLAGALLGNFKGETRKSVGIFCLPMLILSILSMSHVSFFSKDEINYWTHQSVLFSPIEYRPIWLERHRKILPPTEKVTILKGTGSADIGEWKSVRRTLYTRGETDLTLKLSTFYYPGWEASIDGHKKGIQIENGTGSIMIEAPAGLHKIELTFGDTLIRIYGKIISLSAAIAAILLWLHGMLTARKSRHDKVDRRG